MARHASLDSEMTKGSPSCCAQSRANDSSAAEGSAATARGIEPSRTVIPRRWSPPIGGTFLIGSDDNRFPDDGEGPVREVTVSEFALVALRSAICSSAISSVPPDTPRMRNGMDGALFSQDPYPMISSVKSVAGLRIRRGGSRCRMPIGPSQRDSRARFSTGSIIPWCMFPGMMPALTANGRGHGCRPKPNGKWRRAAG